MPVDNKKSYEADCIIIGAGIFGLYAAWLLVKKGKKVIVLERSLKAFSRASAINQARVHNGYHYPRSYETAKKVADYHDRFTHDFAFAINDSFKHIYAIATTKSKRSSSEFVDFCNAVNIPLSEIDSNTYFRRGSVASAYIVKEPVFDYTKIKDFLLDGIRGAHIIYGAQIKNVEKNDSTYSISLNDGASCSAPLVINASYAGINDVIEKFGQDIFKLKYELCEVTFCEMPENLRDIGITVMDGEYFSLLPFGNNKIYSLTAVGYTPHDVSYDSVFSLLKKPLNHSVCEMHSVKGCIVCSQNLKSAWPEMYNLSKNYLKPMFALDYLYSKFEIKPILIESEGDDSRPTIIKQHTTGPTFMSVYSGKISTIYDLEKYL